MMPTLNQDTDSAVERHRILTACLTRKYKLAERAASALADDLALEIRREAGAGPIYIPGLNLGYRNREIVRKYNGKNMAELAKEYNLSERHIARIVSTTSAA